jgi:hypothetical protein
MFMMGKRVFILMALAFLAGQTGCETMKKKSAETPSGWTSLNPAGPRIISRAEWGAKPPRAERFKVHQPKTITLHHAGVVQDPKKDPVKTMRGLQAWCMRDRPWGDLPYHYCIDMQGRIYEGRADMIAGDTNTEYDPTGHLLVEVMGNYEEQVPSEAQLRAVVETMAWLCRKYDVDPETIRSHRDHSTQTVCPGKNLYVYIENGYFIREVKALLEKDRKAE